MIPKTTHLGLDLQSCPAHVPTEFPFHSNGTKHPVLSKNISELPCSPAGFTPPTRSRFGCRLHFCCKVLAACVELAWLGLTLKEENANEMLKHIPMTQSETGGCGAIEGLALHSNHM